MGTAVEDVHHGYGQDLCIWAAHVFVEWKPAGCCSRMSGGQGCTEDGVGPKLGFVIGAIQRKHGIVHRRLFGGIHPDQCLGDFSIYVVDRLAHSLAEIAIFVPVP